MSKAQAAALASNVADTDDEVGPETSGEVGRKPKISIINMTLRSVQPLLQHALTEAVMANLPGGLGNVEKPNEADMTPRARAELCLYKSKKGQLGIPRKCLFAAAVAAGAFVKMGGRRNFTNAEESHVPAFLRIPDAFFPFKNQSPDSWEPDMDSTKNPTTGGRTVTIRPKFEEWEMDVTILVDHAIGVTETQVREIFRQAGYRCGFGAHRKKGPHGRFVITKWEAKEQTEETAEGAQAAQAIAKAA